MMFSTSQQHRCVKYLIDDMLSLHKHVEMKQAFTVEETIFQKKASRTANVTIFQKGLSERLAIFQMVLTAEN